MDDLRDHIRSEEGGLEHLMRKIPGFAGYKDREQRRQADQIQRTFIADALSRERDRLTDVGKVLMAHGGLALLTDIDRVSGLFDKVADRVRHATHGYSGFFDAVRIVEADLDRVYEYDLSMLQELSAVSEAITALGAAAEAGGSEAGQRLRAVEGYAKSLDQKIDNRTRVMMGVS